MSLNGNQKLLNVAKQLSRELRKYSTKTESIFWKEVRNRKFLGKKFYRQYPIFFDMLGKETFFIADFFCFEEKFVVEIDGGYHTRQKEYDELRTYIINNIGIKVIRFKNEEIEKNIQEVLEKLKAEILSK
jgi:very-short-patch-repair endonuclease